MVPGMFTIGGDYGNVASSYMRNLDLIQKRKQAADEAIDKWVGEQTKGLDPNAVRKQDREAFDNMYKDFVSYGIQNKKEIAKNPAARFDFQNRAKELFRFVEDSKNAAKEPEKAVGWLSDPEKRNKVNREAVIGAISAHEQPLKVKDPYTGTWVDNLVRRKIDYTKNYWNVAPPDTNKLFNDVSLGKKTIETKGAYIPNDPNSPEGRARIANEKILRNVVSSYTPESIKEIGVNAYDVVSLNPELNDSYKNALENIKSTDEFKAYQDVLNEYFPGQQITDGASFAKAIALKKAKEREDVYTEEVTDESAQLRRRRAERARSEARADARAARAVAEGEMDNVLDVISTEYSGSGGKFFGKAKGGKITNGVVTDIQGNLVNGTIVLTKQEIPAQVAAAMKSAGFELQNVNNVEVVDGRIQSIQPKGSPKVDRNMIYIGQKKYYRPKKGEQVIFGGGSLDPLGINEEE